MWRRRGASDWLSHELASREAEHGEHTDEVWRSSDKNLQWENSLWEVEEEEGRVGEAAGRVEVEGARAPNGRRASYGNCGSDAQEPGLVFLGIVDELDELLRRWGNARPSGSWRLCVRARWSWGQGCTAWVVRMTWVENVGPTAPRRILKMATIQGAMLRSAGWLTPPSFPLAKSPVIRRLCSIMASKRASQQEWQQGCSDVRVRVSVCVELQSVLHAGRSSLRRSKASMCNSNITQIYLRTVRRLRAPTFIAKTEAQLASAVA